VSSAAPLSSETSRRPDDLQSGLLPNTWATIDQLDDPETRKAIGGVISREMKIKTLFALNGMHVAGKVKMGIQV
jgi:hypothetical protein